MYIRSLTPSERRRVYYDHVVPDIHPIDLKTFEYLEALRQKGIMRILGLFEGADLLGYAYLDSAPGLSVRLLDIFGIVSGQRDKGIGTRFLQLLTEQERFAPALVAEVENPDEAEGNQKALNERRIAFYERAGWHDTGVRVRVAQYRCRIYSPLDTLSEGLLRRDLLALYHAVVGEDYTEEHIRIL